MRKSADVNEDVIRELNELARASGGLLHPQLVVDSASNPQSPLHDRFDWDNIEAGNSWRLEQARQMLRIAVQYIEVEGDKIEARIFVSLTSDRENGGGYRYLVSVLSDEEQRRQLVQDALDEMTRFAEKYRMLDELAGVFKSIGRVRKKLAPANKRK